MTREELAEDTTSQVALVVTTENYTSLSVRCVTVESGKVRSRGPGSREPFLALRHPPKKYQLLKKLKQTSKIDIVLYRPSSVGIRNYLISCISI